MLAKDVRKYIITPTLIQTDTWSESAEILVYGTGFCETNYNYLMQIGTPKNGGIGLFQEEPSDAKDICIWLKNGFNKGMLEKVLKACNIIELPTDFTCLTWNLRLAVMFCRLHYWRIKRPLPAPDDASGMSEYHKRYYNSMQGAADAVKNAEIFQKIIEGEL